VIAAPASGAGKTLITLAVVSALRAAGCAVAVAKAGPDYIDAGYLSLAAGRAAVNLDAWAMPPGLIARLAAQAARGADLLVVEGVMGLFDGAPLAAEAARGGAGSTAALAKALGLPVVLVIDAARQAQSAAALVHGFATFDPELSVAGVILNRIAGERHRRLIAGALEAAGVRVFGALPRLAGLKLPSRHLGLVQAAEHGDPEALLSAAAGAAREHLDLAALVELARPPTGPAPDAAPALPALGQRVAVASDEAFAFAYEHLLADWRAAGAAVVPFSPLADEAPDPVADAVYLPGGYPELHAGRLAGNAAFLAGLAAAARRGAQLFGECGGYMVLGKGLIDAKGSRHAMAGLLGLETSFAERRLTLGYRRIQPLADLPLARAGATLAGHEFHHATIVAEAGDRLFATADAEGRPLGHAGLRSGTVAGSFMHLIAAR
jgi:cobyrinic acid a,c-diamide synthase